MNIDDALIKIQKIYEESIDKNPFIDKSLKDKLLKIQDMIRPIFPDEANITFSSDLNLFNEESYKEQKNIK